MNAPIWIVGAGGHAKVVLATLEACGETCAGFLDDAPHPDAHPLEHLASLPHPVRAVVAIGSNEARQRIDARFADVAWASLVHPRAFAHASAVIGPGAVVFAGCVLQPDTAIGRHVIVNTAATLDHDCRIGDYCHIAPGCHLAGNVVLEESVFLGIGTCVIPGVRIGAGTIVGAGATVTRDLPPGVLAVGTPARVVRKLTL